MGRSTFTQKTDPQEIAKQMQGFAKMVGLTGIEVDCLVSQGGLYRMTVSDGSFRFFEAPNDVTVHLLKMAREKFYIASFRKDIGKGE